MQIRSLLLVFPIASLLSIFDCFLPSGILCHGNCAFKLQHRFIAISMHENDDQEENTNRLMIIENINAIYIYIHF